MHERRPKQVGPLSQQDLERDVQAYRSMALSMGASDAKVIAADRVYVDTRVRAKCSIPKCPEYGISAHCPPHCLDANQIRDLVSAYHLGLLVKLDIDSNIMVGDGLGVTDEGGKIVTSPALTKLLNRYRKISDIVTQIESQAFYDGHYLAVAFSAGSCHAAYCNFKECQVLKGMPCRFPLRARPSMEGSSIDAFRMAAEAGWDVFPVGSDCNPACVPHGTLLGLVLVD
ncbi:MAG: DUF2284 domain-containing protein [Terriglobales bacterium]